MGGASEAGEARCPLPNPPPLRGRGDCRRLCKSALSRTAGEGGTRAAGGWGQTAKLLPPCASGFHPPLHHPRGAAARRSRSLMATPSPSSGIGITAMARVLS
ncbi:hypothetical protein DS837_22120 [Azospirillum brasilense]|uniref:Uncharacterized protein n=1 Tax=Azospirillum brasilense TaxID=192 RepID=A0A6L3AVK6_AZOBR|nr:hypothetical protein DS837_22120 [Azospirillum brasilense]